MEVVATFSHKQRSSKSNNMPLSERKDNNTKHYIHNANVKTKEKLLHGPATPNGRTLKSKDSDSSGAKRLAEFTRRLQERHINAAKNKEN